MKTRIMKKLGITTLLVFLTMVEPCFAFDDWVQMLESSTPGAVDYQEYLNFLWRIVKTQQGENSKDNKTIPEKVTTATVKNSEERGD